MHPTEHRGLRELYAMSRQLRDHWRSLAGRLDAAAPDQAQTLRGGSDLARTLIGELTRVTAARGLHGRPLAEGLGAQLAAMHSVLLDTALEVNQALRFAVLDAVHVVALLEFLARVAEQEGDGELHAFLDGWSRRMRAQEEAIRAAVVALGADPDLAVRASTPGRAGRLAHGAANALGTLGEWVDRRAAR
jgi:hypothetical protein